MELLEEIKEWAKFIGSRRAAASLVATGISPSTADKLVRGAYKNAPSFIYAKLIREAMEQNANPSTGDAAS